MCISWKPPPRKKDSIVKKGPVNQEVYRAKLEETLESIDLIDCSVGNREKQITQAMLEAT